MPPEEAIKWGKEVSHSSYVIWEEPAVFEPWAEGIRCAFILLSEDLAIPLPVQQQLAASMGPDLDTLTLKAGHCPFQSIPDETLKAVEELVELAVEKKI